MIDMMLGNMNTFFEMQRAFVRPFNNVARDFTRDAIDVTREAIDVTRDVATAGNKPNTSERGNEAFRMADSREERLRYVEEEGQTEIGGATQVIPVLREELEIRKQVVRGGKTYRIVQTVIERPVEKDISLRSENVVIERRRSNGSEAFNADAEFSRGGVIEVHEMHEVPVVEKYVTATEEIVIRKAINTRTTRVREMVREKRVDVEQQADRVILLNGHHEQHSEQRGDMGQRRDRGDSHEQRADMSHAGSKPNLAASGNAPTKAERRRRRRLERTADQSR